MLNVRKPTFHHCFFVEASRRSGVPIVRPECPHCVPGTAMRPKTCRHASCWLALPRKHLLAHRVNASASWFLPPQAFEPAVASFPRSSLCRCRRSISPAAPLVRGPRAAPSVLIHTSHLVPLIHRSTLVTAVRQSTRIHTEPILADTSPNTTMRVTFATEEQAYTIDVDAVMVRHRPFPRVPRHSLRALGRHS